MSGLVIGQSGWRKNVLSVALTVPSFLTVTGSPITDTGTLAVTLTNQSTNRFFAGPATGADATPTFRAIVAADLPAEALTGGTVTSVALSVPSFLSVTGSPITTSGTLAVSLADQSPNLVFAGPASGGAAAPTFRSLVVADVPVLDDTRLANAVILAPADSARNVIQPTGAAVIPFIIKGAASQSASLQEWQDSTGAVVAKVTSSGRFGFTTTTPQTRIHATANDAVTNTVTNLLTIDHVTTSTPAAGFGTAIVYQGQAETTANLKMARLKSLWTNTTVATRNAKFVLSVYGIVSSSETEQDALTLLATTTGQALAGINQATPTTALHVSLDDTATAAVTNLLTIDHTSTGTPAAGFGAGIQFLGESSTTVQRSMGRVRTEWTTATDAIRASKMVLSSYAIGVETDGLTLTPTGAYFNTTLAVGAAVTSSYMLVVRGTVAKANGAFETVVQFQTGDSSSPMVYSFGFQTSATAGSRYGSLEVDEAGTKRMLALNAFGGGIGLATTQKPSSGVLGIGAIWTVDNLAQVQIGAGAATNKGLVVQGYSSQTAHLQQWQNNSATVIAFVDSQGRIGAGLTGPLSNAAISAQALSSNQAVAIFRGASGQTASLQEAQTVSATVVASIGPTGSALNQPVTSILPTLITRASANRAATATNKQLTSNVATLTFASHSFLVSETVVISGVDATFNGTYTITAVTSTTISYAKVASDVALTSATGTATVAHTASIQEWQTGANAFLVGIAADGKVGIGAAAASFPLEVHAASSRVYINSTTTTNLSLVQFNNGGGSAFIGIERSTGGALATNTAAYSLVLSSPNGSAYPIHFVASNTVRATVLATGEFGVGTVSPSTQLHVVIDNSATNTVTNVLTIEHSSTGTPAAGFGTGIQLLGESDTTTQQLMGRVRSTWQTATHASRKARVTFSAYDTAERDALMIEADGSNPMIGFLGTAPVAKPTVTGSRGGNAALADLLTKLAAFGLITDGSSA